MGRKTRGSKRTQPESDRAARWGLSLAIVAATAGAALLAPRAAAAQARGTVAAAATGSTTDPAFQFGQRAKVKKAVFLASLNSGVLITGGNSNVITLSAGGFVSWKTADNKLQLDANGAYAQQHNLVAEDLNNNGTIERNEITSQSRTGAQNWLVKLRYDRFFSDSDSVYASPFAGGDRLNGKAFYGGGQLGYSRLVYADDLHEVTAELGYDFTREEYDSPPGSSLNVHSARLFLGYKLQLAADIAATTGLEVLSNVAAEDTPLGNIGAFRDTRANWKNALTAKVWKNISVRSTFLIKYDAWPAPRPAFDVPFAPGVLLEADKLDTQTEMALVVNFL